VRHVGNAMDALAERDKRHKETLIDTGWIGWEKLLTRDGGEDGHQAGTGDISTPHEDRGAGFANIRIQKRLDRFTLRGKIKVNIQWLLYCMVHNIEKIVHFGPEFAVG